MYTKIDPSSEESVRNGGIALIVIGVISFAIEVTYFSSYPTASIGAFVGVTFLAAFMLLIGVLLIPLRRGISSRLKSKNLVYFVSSLFVFVIGTTILLLVQCVSCAKIVTMAYVICLFAAIFFVWVYHCVNQYQETSHPTSASENQVKGSKDEPVVQLDEDIS